ncbi:protein HGH1 homolog [Paramacrobiotus metropolitanus]|uniref:protein HGH1 homolog n=1 Tax=Paramacrobiotus metropolitanus TaxID=2943436 RepID=UPI00244649B4|nr:protein HGH1 homolog [Paramacrobiotus metropolitanus]
MEPGKTTSTSLDEMVGLLKTHQTNAPLMSIALRSLAEATCVPANLENVAAHSDLVSQLIGMIDFQKDAPLEIRQQSYLLEILVNISSHDGDRSLETFIALRKCICAALLSFNENPALKDFSLLNKTFAILNNLTQRMIPAQEVFSSISHEQWRFLLGHFDAANRDPSSVQLVFFPSLLVNLSRLTEFRRFLLDHQRLVFQRLLPFMDQKFPVVIRAAVMRLVRNCSFDPDVHPWLLSEEVGLLPCLLLPLAGPEELDEDEMEKLPIDLQYLPEHKAREPESALRVVLLETLLQLCCTVAGRKTLKDNGVYYILRELHKVEKDAAVILACENVVDPLISDEPPENMQNLRQIDIPEKLVAQFDEMNNQLANANPGDLFTVFAGDKMPRPKSKDVDKPRGKMTAYAFFLQICREDHKKKHPNDQVNFAEFSKKCAEKWKEMGDKEKKRFLDLAAQDKVRYENEMRHYVPPEGSPRKRKRGKKDPNAPKRALSAFFWYCNDERPKVKALLGSANVGEIAKELGKRWATTTAADKAKYEALAGKDKERYERENKAFKAGGGGNRGGAAPAAKVAVSHAPVPESDDEDDDDDDDEEDDD